jgi:hypothetical protein
MGHTRIYVTALAALLVPASVGVVAVHASPTCEKFVKTYVSTPVRNRVSKTTAEAWAKWRVGHPNWKPNPKLKRPRYKMSQHEVLKKVDFACQVPTDPKMMDILFTPEDLHPPMPEVALNDMPPVETTNDTVPDTIPPLMAELPPSSGGSFPMGNVLPPYFPPAYGTQIPPVIPPSLHVSAPLLPPGPPDSPVISLSPVPPTSPVISLSPVPPDTPVVDTPVIPVSPVPEPSSFVLLLLGMGSGGAVRVWRVRRVEAVC